MDHVASLRRAFDHLNEGNLDGFMDLFADDFVEHQVLGDFPPTKEGVRQFFEAFFEAFPDLRNDIEDVVAEGDKVVVRVRATGTNEGTFMGMPPTGKSIDLEAIDIVRFRDDGKAVEHWGAMDVMEMMQQLGAVPGGAA
jgi:steroid delta-isomerase-like uncharacterized protein